MLAMVEKKEQIKIGLINIQLQYRSYFSCFDRKFSHSNNHLFLLLSEFYYKYPRQT